MQGHPQGEKAEACLAAVASELRERGFEGVGFKGFKEISAKRIEGSGMMLWYKLRRSSAELAMCDIGLFGSCEHDSRPWQFS